MDGKSQTVTSLSAQMGEAEGAWIYIVGWDDQGPVKIGATRNQPGFMRRAQDLHPHPLRVFAAFHAPDMELARKVVSRAHGLAQALGVLLMSGYCSVTPKAGVQLIARAADEVAVPVESAVTVLSRREREAERAVAWG